MISTRHRFRGLERAMRERFGSGASLNAYEGTYKVSFGQQAAKRFIDESHPATAIFAGSDEIAIGLMEVFQDEGTSTPGDVSLVGFDDIPPLHLFAPPLTAVRQPVRALGRRALSLLLETNWQEREPHA